MNRLIFVCLFAVSFAGCQKDSHEKIAGEYLDVMKDLVVVCDKIEDGVTANAKQKKIASIIDQLKSLQTRSEELGEITEESKTRIDKKFKSDFEDLQTKYEAAMKKVETPKVKKVLETELKALARMMNAKLY